jgi:4,5-DOPA dioxygenase extradiol
MRFPAVFVNHGGGPLPLLGRQPELVQNMKDIVEKHLPPEPPKAIVVLSAHWESNPIKITAGERPAMDYDYYNFPPETYKYSYPAPGSPDLAEKIQILLGEQGLKSELDKERGFDHGVFIPLMIMYPDANIPVVCVSLHDSLSAEINMNIGKALQSLRDEDVLILGSGYAFHNMKALFNPSEQSVQASIDFNLWLKDTILSGDSVDLLQKLKEWDKAPGARISHPREEHLLPLLMVAAAGGNASIPRLIYDTTGTDNRQAEQLTQHAVTGYLFN